MLTSTRGFSGTGYQMVSITFYNDRPWLPWQRKLRQTDSAGIENIAVPLAPSRWHSCHQNTPFKPLTAISGPTGRPVTMSMKLKKNKNRRLTMTNSRMRRHTPFGPTDPNFCMWGGVTDVINCAKFFENRFRGPGAGRPWKMAIPIESVHRPYNSAALPRRLW